MTFSIVGRCARTGMFGVAVTTSSICVGARCSHARAGVGAVATQNITDPALGPLTLEYLERRRDAASAIARATYGRQHLEYRQLVAIDQRGRTAVHTGDKILGLNGDVAGRDCHAAGNLLARPGVPHAMTDVFARRPELHLAERLLRALEAGIDAGGEEGDVHSAHLLVVHEHSFPLVDLRVDWDDRDPVAALRKLWVAYEPQMQDYVTRAVDPENAPSYGVPGDE